MSPPQQSVKPSPGDYSYKTRSQTPDRMGISNLLGPRPYRSGSGNIMQDSRSFEDATMAASRAAFPRFGKPTQQPSNQEPIIRTDQSFNHARRTSISGILQRPSSQPQPQAQSTFPGPRLQPVNHPQPHSSTWSEHSDPHNSRSFNNPSSPVTRGLEYGNDAQEGQSGPSTTAATQYDIRPPPLSSALPQQSLTQKDGDTQPSASAWEPPLSNVSISTSPDSRRHTAGPSHFRPFGGLLNGQPPATQPQLQESQHPASVSMSKQDSAQSHGDRSVFGERLDKSRSRLFSPFAGSQTSQSLPSTSGPPDEQSRKGSDELCHHRALLGLAAEGKKGGRYSPLPQAVQGAQARSVGPEMGIKSEHGRIFSGLGSGVGTASASPAHGLPGLAASPFKKDDNGPRLPNEDNFMKISRSTSTSGLGKRARKVKEEDGKAASETDGTGRIGKKPRNHQ